MQFKYGSTSVVSRVYVVLIVVSEFSADDDDDEGQVEERDINYDQSAPAAHRVCTVYQLGFYSITACDNVKLDHSILNCLHVGLIFCNLCYQKSATLNDVGGGMQ